MLISLNKLTELDKNRFGWLFQIDEVFNKYQKGLFMILIGQNNQIISVNKTNVSVI